MKKRVYVPAGHKAILAGSCDDSGSLIGVLAVGDHPCDGFGMVASDIFDGHGVFGI